MERRRSLRLLPRRLRPRLRRSERRLVPLAHTIRAATEEDARTYDLLRGDEGYKSRFETGRNHITTAVVVPAGGPRRAAIEVGAALWRNRDRAPDSLSESGKRLYEALGRLMPTNRHR